MDRTRTHDPSRAGSGSVRIPLANREGRAFLTRNTRLDARYPAARRALALTATDPVAQLRELAARLNLNLAGELFTACIRCNVPLRPVADKREIEDRVHPNVYARFERFERCPACGTVFWHGSHVRNTRRKLGLPAPSLASPDVTPR